MAGSFLEEGNFLGEGSASQPPPRRILAVVLPHLLCELAQQRLHPAGARAPATTPEAHSSPMSKVSRSRKLEPPRAIVLQAAVPQPLEGNTELDAVNATAHQLGVRVRHTIAQASAMVENLSVHALPRACVDSALKHIAEVTLGFGSPASFEAPDTVWVDISGSSHLFASERELALDLATQIRALGHSTRVAVAPGPWLARAFARYGQLEEAGVLLVDRSQAARAVGQLPIIALPIQRDAVGWFSRLGLLTLEDLGKLPASSLAARLQGQVPDAAIETILELIRGQDEGILLPHHPEELPREDLFWEEPLENVEPLLFVLKGLSGRLSARLQGRGQAARELLLTIHYERSIAALAATSPVATSPVATSPVATSPVPETKSLSFKLAAPLFHAEDLERVMRLRLQRQSLLAPTLGLSLQAAAVTESRPVQMSLSGAAEWQFGTRTDPRSLSMLVAELSSDIGAGGVGMLVSEDSHLLEKSSSLLPLRENFLEADFLEVGSLEDGLALPRVPTRLLDPPIEIHAPIRKQELWVVGERAFVVSDIRFEQRLEGIEWWDRARVFRDYFRVWLAVPREGKPRESCSREQPFISPRASRTLEQSGGLEALVYRDRARGKSYLQALYD